MSSMKALVYPEPAKKALEERPTSGITASGSSCAPSIHCLPAVPSAKTEVDTAIAKRFGIDCTEVPDDVFESPASTLFDPADNRRHTVTAILVATIAG
jgi:ornithine carbamoyltransferase